MKFCWCLPNLSRGSGYAKDKNRNLVVLVVASCPGQRKILDYLLAFLKHSKRSLTVCLQGMGCATMYIVQHLGRKHSNFNAITQIFSLDPLLDSNQFQNPPGLHSCNLEQSFGRGENLDL